MKTPSLLVEVASVAAVRANATSLSVEFVAFPWLAADAFFVVLAWLAEFDVSTDV